MIGLIILKYVCMAVAIFCTLLFVSNIVSDLSTPVHAFIKPENENKPIDHAGFRFVLAVFMSITWPVVFLI